jgi:MYXO-CTERM domain-containing protein
MMIVMPPEPEPITPAPLSKPGGCSCDVGGGQQAGAPAVAGLALALLARRIRRRTRSA